MFWTFAAMAVAMRPRDEDGEYQLSPLDRYIMAAGAAAGLLMFGWVLLLPAVRQAKHLDNATAAYRIGSKAELIESDLKQAARALPGDPWPDVFAARVLAERGQLDKAIEHQRRAASLSPHDWVVRGQIAELLTERASRSSDAGDWVAANTAYRMALRCYPSSTQLHESFADAYARQDNWAAAAEHYRKALQFDEAKEIDPNYQWPPRTRREVQVKLQEALQKFAGELPHNLSP